MKQMISRIARMSGVVAAGAMLSAPATFAADEAALAQPAVQSPAQSPEGARGNRGERGTRGNPGETPERRATPPNFAGGRGGFGLNLDEKQNELLREAMQAESDELRKLSEKLQAAQKELMTAVVAEKYDEAVVRQKADAVSKIQTDITVLRAKAFAAVAPTLKPEQREQIENNRMVSSIITGAGLSFGGGGGFGGPPQDQGNLRRNDRGGDRGDRGTAPGGDSGQPRRRGGDRPGEPGQ